MLSKDLGNYVVYEDGTVWSTYVNRFLSISATPKGYLTVGMAGRNYFIHRLVAWVVGILEDVNDTSVEIDHKDTDKLNNHPSNLQALTVREHQLKTLVDRGLEARANIAKVCIDCGLPTSDTKATRCLLCYKITVKPKMSIEDIGKLVLGKGSWVAAAKVLGISDNGLRKRYKALGGDPKELKKKNR